MQSLMVGRLLGATALGRLTVSQTLVYLPFNRVAGPIQEVMFPAFSRMQDEPARIMGALNRVNQVIAAIAFPTLTGLAILAPEFTSVVLGSKWAGTEEVIRVLALAGMALALQRVNFSVLSARGYTRPDHVGGRRALVSTVVAILVAYPFGLVATVAALAAQTLVLQAVIMSVTARALDARFRDLARPLARIAAATCVMAASVVLVVEALREVGVGGAGILVAGIATGAVVFLPLLLRLEPELIAELRGFARHGRRPTDAPSRSLPARAAGSLRRGTHLDEPSDVERPPSRLLRAPRPERRADHRAGDRIGTGSDVRGLGARHLRQPVDRRDVGDLRLLRGARRAYPPCPDRAATSRSTRTFVRRSITRAARTSAGTETTTGWSPSMPSAPWRPLERVARVRSLHDGPAVLPRRTPAPVNDPIPVLGGVDSADAADRVRALLASVPERRPSESTPSTHSYGGTWRHGRPSGLHPRRGLRVLVRDGAPRAVRPRTRGPGAIAGCRPSRGTPMSKTFGIRPGWRRFFQREVSLIQVVEAIEEPPAWSRLASGAALVGFAAREHAHGVRRRARRLVTAR